MAQIEGRFTYKKLTEWVNKEFERIEINGFKCTGCERTYFNQDQIEGGAARMYFHIRTLALPENSFMGTFTLLGFYTVRQYEDHCKIGYELYFRLDDLGIIKNIEIDLRRKPETK